MNVKTEATRASFASLRVATYWSGLWRQRRLGPSGLGKRYYVLYRPFGPKEAIDPTNVS